MNSVVRWSVAVILLVGLIPMTTSGTAIATAHADQPVETTSVDLSNPSVHPSLAVQASDDEENETDRHRDPDDYEDDGNLEGLASFLSGRLANQLGDSAIQLSEGEYELAREVIGDQYSDRLGQYVDVAGDIDGESYEDIYRDTRDEQQTLVNQRQEYQETRDAYEEAVAAGNTERARELARQLNTLANEINLTTTSLQDRYEQIESATGENLSAARESLREVEQEVSTDVATILSSEFTETQLTVAVDSDTISFLDPLSTTGRLTTAGGEPITNESIQLTVGSQSIQTTTNADGLFNLTYRPTLLPLSTTLLTVEYTPANQSLYLGSETNVNVTVEQAQARFTNVDSPDELAYAEPGRVTGDLLVDNLPVNDVPVTVSVDDQQVDTLRTNNGSFSGNLTVPATIPDGDRTFNVRLATENQALAPALETQSVTVRESETTLKINARGDGSQITVNGTLATNSGVGVGGQPIQLQIEGTTIGTATTTVGGAFSEVVTIPESISEESVRVSAAYRGTGTNLGGSEDETIVQITLDSQTGSESSGFGSESSGFGSESSGFGMPVWVWVLIVALLSSILALAWIVRTRAAEGSLISEFPIVRSLQSRPNESASESPSSEGRVDTDGEQAGQPATVAALLHQASTELQSGSYSTAVQACYSAVRWDLSTQIGGAETLTHWEFYQAYSETEQADSTPDALRELTEEYERAAFSGDSVTQDHAQRVLAQAKKLCRVNDDSFHAS